MRSEYKVRKTNAMKDKSKTRKKKERQELILSFIDDTAKTKKEKDKPLKHVKYARVIAEITQRLSSLGFTEAHIISFRDFMSLTTIGLHKSKRSGTKTVCRTRVLP